MAANSTFSNDDSFVVTIFLSTILSSFRLLAVWGRGCHNTRGRRPRLSSATAALTSANTS